MLPYYSKMSSLLLIFFHIIFIHDCYSFDTNPPSCKYGYLPPHVQYSVEQVPLLLFIGLDKTWYTKVSHGHVCVSQPDAGSKKNLPVNSASVSMQYNFRFQSSLGEQGIVLQILRKTLQILYALVLKNKAWTYGRVLPEWENTHICQISEYHHTEEDGCKEGLLLLKY